MPNSQGLQSMTLLQKWRYRFKTMVRYRLLFLTSAPIILTLLALIAITIYWSIHYTWNSALIDVSERLTVADNTITLIQQKQSNAVTGFANSYEFQSKIRSENVDLNELKAWVKQQPLTDGLDYLLFETPEDALGLYVESTQPQTSFEVVDEQTLYAIAPSLAERAKTKMIANDTEEKRGLVSRTIFPLYSDNHELLGYLHAGSLINNSSELVDTIRDVIYPIQDASSPHIGTLTLFLEDLRISTNVPLNSDEQRGRASGSKVSQEVQQAVLVEGKRWVDRAYVYDAWYITAYKPLRNSNDEIVGMLYTGYLLWPFIKAYLTNIIEISIATLSLLIISGFMVYRGSRDLFRPIEQIHKVVKQVQMGKNNRIGSLGLDDKHELAQLAKQFDNMLDSLESRKEEIERAAQDLECKVNKRTASLKEKTQQLEHHINLLNQTRDKLVTNEKLAALGELTAGIAHEINNPTAVILGNVELIRFELGEDSLRVNEEIDAILEQIDRIRNITRSLLQYSRQGGVQDQITWQHVNPIIDESITLVKTGSKKKEIQFVTQLDAHTSVEVNRHQLLQVLVNLQMNAIYAMKGEGVLTIISRDWNENGENLGAVIDVIDEGCGMKPAQLQRIFDPFYTTKRDGTGLGLSVSQSILSETGGEIRVSSIEGEGSTFSIYLPKKYEKEELSVTAVGMS